MKTVTVPKGVIKRIHVNRHHIATNRKGGKPRTVFTIKTRLDGKPVNLQAHEFTTNGSLLGVNSFYHKCKALSCGARVWLETVDEITCLVDD